MLKAVDDVLEDIGAGENARLLVLNKADQVDRERRTELAHVHPEGVLVSAATGEGIEGLRLRILEEFEKGLRDIELLIPYNEGAKLAELHEMTHEIEREDTPEGVRVRLQLPTTIAARYDRFSTAPPAAVDEFGDPLVAPPAAAANRSPEPAPNAAPVASEPVAPTVPAHAA